MAGDRHQGGTELGRFLRARREEVTPDQVGLTAGPGLRRTPGLRREELATLAGVSVDYYTRLERGRETRPSPAVVDALARALRLGEPEHQHLLELAVRAARHIPDPAVVPSRTVKPGVKQLLEALRPHPAVVQSRTMDVLAANPAGFRLYAGMQDWPAKHRNLARYTFLHPAARTLFHNWNSQLRGCVARLRALAGTDPDAPDLAALVGELLLKSPEFAKLWERYDVRPHTAGTKTFHHPEVGDLTLGYQGMLLEGAPGHRMSVYHAEPGTPDHDAMILLDMAAPASTDTHPIDRTHRPG
ncbi:helix-turn-helix transcriptional regulator [Actinomadura luteofluorescens]|uniref:helix-turn-helix transcriptional regulator n=1 Tax=Actinomadura luteofluorescens TaxID=46163 RepID=UPI003D89C502